MTNSNPSSDESTTGASTRWRDDPLSVCLVVAAVVLGAMYAYQRWQTARLDEQIARAQSIGDGFAVDAGGCEVASAGLAGDVLVVQCDGLSAAKVADVAASVDGLAEPSKGLRQVVLRGADHQFVCPLQGPWPDACRREKRPIVQ